MTRSIAHFVVTVANAISLQITLQPTRQRRPIQRPLAFLIEPFNGLPNTYRVGCKGPEPHLITVSANAPQPEETSPPFDASTSLVPATGNFPKFAHPIAKLSMVASDPFFSLTEPSL
jgi:hypothetical protein